MKCAIVLHCRPNVTIGGQEVWVLRDRLRSSPVKQHWSISWCWQSRRWETIVQSCSFHYGAVQISEGMSSPPCKLFAKGQTFGGSDNTTSHCGGVDSLDAKGHRFVSQHEPEASKGQVFNTVLGGCDNRRQSCRIGSSQRAIRCQMTRSKCLFVFSGRRRRN